MMSWSTKMKIAVTVMPNKASSEMAVAIVVPIKAAPEKAATIIVPIKAPPGTAAIKAPIARIVAIDKLLCFLVAFIAEIPASATFMRHRD